MKANKHQVPRVSGGADGGPDTGGAEQHLVRGPG